MQLYFVFIASLLVTNPPFGAGCPVLSVGWFSTLFPDLTLLFFWSHNSQSPVPLVDLTVCPQLTCPGNRTRDKALTGSVFNHWASSRLISGNIHLSKQSLPNQILGQYTSTVECVLLFQSSVEMRSMIPILPKLTQHVLR